MPSLLSVDKLGAMGEPESPTSLRNTTEAMLPRVELPDLLFEVHSHRLARAICLAAGAGVGRRTARAGRTNSPPST